MQQFIVTGMSCAASQCPCREGCFKGGRGEILFSQFVDELHGR